MYLATGAPGPILLHLEQTWRFTPNLLTIAYAAYSAGLLVALLFFGSLSDFLGRRPVLVIALSAQAVTVAGLALSSDIGVFVALRVLQGMTIGVAASAFTAFVVESASAKRKRMGAALGSLVPVAAGGVGGFLGGATADLVPDPARTVFGVLSVVTLVSVIVVLLCTETVARVPGALRALAPSLSLSANARRPYALVAPLLVAAWMVPALYLALGPVVIRDVFLVGSGSLVGLSALLQPVAAAACGIYLERLSGRLALRIGALCTVIGPGLVLVSVVTGAFWLFMVAGVVCGAAYGITFGGVVARLVFLVDNHRRAGLLAVIYVTGYFSFGASSVISGQLIEPVGLLPVAIWFSATISGLGMIGFLLELRRRPRMP